ncbi:hypothetical protein IW261DRAFT_1426873 [Armillaria novae-zelandiae]|uniref:Uncharacterized protein n=1 Tax=Armillaria novae-zelandiae TaxID=153914 RepID=A0AA39U3X6_9AGAR|nr:hypothetical protein IW261DRAFT_1426873 [Armillaria novae-zelandiae]
MHLGWVLISLDDQTGLHIWQQEQESEAVMLERWLGTARAVLGFIVTLPMLELCQVFGFMLWVLVHLVPPNVAFPQCLLIVVALSFPQGHFKPLLIFTSIKGRSIASLSYIGYSIALFLKAMVSVTLKRSICNVAISGDPSEHTAVLMRILAWIIMCALYTMTVMDQEISLYPWLPDVP